MKTRLTKRIETALSVVATGALVSLVATTSLAHAHDSAPKSKPFIDNFSTVTQGDTSAPTAGPEAGDQNPYGVAVIPRSVGKLIARQHPRQQFQQCRKLARHRHLDRAVLTRCSDSDHLRGNRREHAAGRMSGGVGLTTALTVLRTGWVIVGSLPTTDGTIGTVGAGCLIVLDANGKPVETFSGGVINGPWDMAASDGGRAGGAPSRIAQHFEATTGHSLTERRYMSKFNTDVSCLRWRQCGGCLPRDRQGVPGWERSQRVRRGPPLGPDVGLPWRRRRRRSEPPG